MYLKYIKKWNLVIEILGVNNMIVKRGDMFYADLSPVIGSEQRRNKTSCNNPKWYGK